jgi:phage terminase small subunit
VLAELKRLAFCDPRELFDSAGNLRPITLLPADVGCSIALLDVARAREGSDTVVRVRLWDKLRALELLGKHLSLFVGKVEHAGGITVQWLTPDFSEPSSVADVIDVVAPSAERDDRDADTTKDDS